MWTNFIAAVIVRPLVWVSDKVFWHVVDEGVIDGTVNGVARVSRESGDQLRHVTSGNIRSYAAWIVLGVWYSLPCCSGWWANVQQPYLLTVLTFLPVAGTLALLLLRDDDHIWIRRLALATAVAEFAISLLLLRGFISTPPAISGRSSAPGFRSRRFTITWALTASACSWSC